MICYCEIGIKNRGRKKVKYFIGKMKKWGRIFPTDYITSLQKAPIFSILLVKK